MTLQPIWLTEDAPVNAFPDVEFALTQPNGLLAVGGDLGPDRILCAYRRGIFPWYSTGQPILWWAPDPRAVLYPEDLRITRSFARTLRRCPFEIAIDRAFPEVVRRCAAPRPSQSDTWITNEMFEAYCCLHHLGHAHSVETRLDGELVGGLYGIAIGRVFFGESMFSAVSDASKVALAQLCRMGFALVDCQLPSPHLARMGAVDIARQRFVAHLDRWCEEPQPEMRPQAAEAPT